MKGEPQKLPCPIQAMVGCTRQSFRARIEAEFEPGMTWVNYGSGGGTWQLDHRIPCAEFTLGSWREDSRCFHYSNLRPCWSTENARKGRKLGAG